MGLVRDSSMRRGPTMGSGDDGLPFSLMLQDFASHPAHQGLHVFSGNVGA